MGHGSRRMLMRGGSRKAVCFLTSDLPSCESEPDGLPLQLARHTFALPLYSYISECYPLEIPRSGKEKWL
jgi:hypothetical protein